MQTLLEVLHSHVKRDQIMIKKSLMAVILFFYSLAAISQTETNSCNFSGKAQAANFNVHFNSCGIDTTHKPTEGFANASHEANADTHFPFHVRKNKSSLAESLTVVLFIPALIILLFSRLTKSAK
jgi:hypothetical protein